MGTHHTHISGRRTCRLITHPTSWPNTTSRLSHDSRARAMSKRTMPPRLACVPDPAPPGLQGLPSPRALRRLVGARRTHQGVAPAEGSSTACRLCLVRPARHDQNQVTLPSRHLRARWAQQRAARCRLATWASLLISGPRALRRRHARSLLLWLWGKPLTCPPQCSSTLRPEERAWR